MPPWTPNALAYDSYAKLWCDAGDNLADYAHAYSQLRRGGTGRVLLEQFDPAINALHDAFHRLVQASAPLADLVINDLLDPSAYRASVASCQARVMRLAQEPKVASATAERLADAYARDIQQGAIRHLLSSYRTAAAA